MIQKFRKINSPDTDLMLVQDNITNTFNPLTRIPILDGQLLEDISLTNTPQRIDHTLGRTPIGYIVVKLNKSATIHSDESDSRLITLTSSAADTVCSLWIF